MTDWHLDVTSWRGVTPGATHYYGIIQDDDFDGPRHEILRVLDEAGARALSAPDRYGIRDDFLWKAGDDTSRFDSKEELVAAAIALFKEESPDWDTTVAAPGERLWNRSSIYVEREILATKAGQS